MSSAEVTTDPPKISVGPEEAARITGLNRSAIYQAQARGDITGFKIGRRRLFLVKELERWMRKASKEGAR